MRINRNLFVPMALAWVLLLSGCDPGHESSSRRPLQPGEVAYETSGLIRDFPVDGRTVVIRHEEIPGYMPRMTMTFTVDDPRELAGLRVGEVVAFRLIVTSNDHRIDTLRRIKGSTLSPPIPSSPPPETASSAAVQLGVGQLMPDFRMLDEDGVPRNLSDFRGSAVAFTFIFTRCPLPDFCPRMSQHFARSRQQLQSLPGASTNWMFLSLSFDPEHDRPEVLRRYGSRWRGDSPDRWVFASIAGPVLASLAPALDLKVQPEDGTFMHNLRTVVIDTNGRIHRQFDGNDWTPEELTDALQAAATAGTP
jgi:protein SCO1/2